MEYKVCPECGAEYRAGFDICSDCQAPLLDPLAEGVLQPDTSTSRTVPEFNPHAQVFVTGRRIDAEIARSFLESQGFQAKIWSSGLSPWFLAAVLTELTGLPNGFNAHRVMVPKASVFEAKGLLEEPPTSQDQLDPHKTDDLAEAGRRSFMDTFRRPWMRRAFAIYLLLIGTAYGSP